MVKSHQKICAIILARSGSKGLKDKNIKDLDGKPLIAYTIEDALRSSYINRVIVSTDSKKIASIANDYGAETPFFRPEKIAEDSTTSEETLLHALEYLNEKENYFPEIIVYMQITEPFRPKHIIDACIEELISDSNLDSVFAGNIKHKNYWIEKNGRFIKITEESQSALPRQSKKAVFREDTGVMLATKAHVVKSGRRIGENVKIIPYEDDLAFMDIHSNFDLKLSNLIKTNIEKLYE